MNVSLNVAEVPNPFAMRFTDAEVGVCGNGFIVRAGSYAELALWLETCANVVEAARDREIEGAIETLGDRLDAEQALAAAQSADWS